MRSNGRGRGHRFISLVGQSFERLRVIERAPNSSHRQAQWHCLCVCGTAVIVAGSSLRKGHTRSCGCLRPEAVRRNMTIHGQSRTPEYLIYRDMKDRCLNPHNHAYKNYGGRGILLLWDSLEAFVQDMGLRPTPQHSIERLDNDGPYSKANCTWATVKEQSNNRRSNRHIEYQGRLWTLAQLAKHLGMNYQTLYHRVKHGRYIEQTYKKRIKHMVPYQGRLWPLADLAVHLGVPYETLRYRVKQGLPLV